MKTLHETLQTSKAGAASLRKHLSAVGINEWEDMTRAALYDFRDHLAEAVAPSTARTLCANLKAILNRYCDDVALPGGWPKILSVKATKPLKTYLTETDLDKFASAPAHTAKMRLVQNLFLISAYTGLRVSDAMALTLDNIDGDTLRYVAKKTKKAGVIPLKPGVAERIKWVAEHPGLTVTTKSYNEAVKRMCRLAGIDEEVVVLKAGKELKGPKWMFVSSHQARISMATNLARRGVSITEVKNLLGHSAVSVTERYIVPSTTLSPMAMAYFS